MEETGLIDIWRSLSPLEKDFTHYSATHKIHSRIDYFFINMGDRHRVIECKIGGADTSDHHALFLKINLNARKRQTIWRLNVGIKQNKGLVKDFKVDFKKYMEENSNGELGPHII